MTCAVRSCRNEVYRCPDLSFFSLPTLHDVREEWLEVLGLERLENVRRLKVCELHFKPKDFCEGRKQLKSHAIPVLRLGSGKSDLIDSDDEFMDFQSDSEQDIVEISNAKQTNGKSKQETPEKEETIEVITNFY